LIALREQFADASHVQPLDEDQRQLVRGSRHSGKNRLLRRMALGVVKSLEVEDVSPTSAAHMTSQPPPAPSEPPRTHGATRGVRVHR
jgi:hypothetical protein